MNRNPISLFAWVTGSWLGSWFSFLMSHANAFISVLSGVLTVVLSIYGILVARATLKLRRKQIKEAELSDIDDGRPLAALAGLLILSVLFTGCSFNAHTLNKTETALDEESRVLTTAVVDTLNAQPTSNRDVYTSTALTLAKQDQRIEGLPAHPLDVISLVQSNAQAIADLNARFAMQDDLLEKQRQTTDRLIQYGEQFEQERNKSIVHRFWRWLTATFGIGGIIALCVFCPAAIPIFARIAAWIVGKIPSLASAIGVVSRKAYDQVVKGVELAKVEIATHQDGQKSIDVLHASLSRSMDDSTKRLVRHRKLALTTA